MPILKRGKRSRVAALDCEELLQLAKLFSVAELRGELTEKMNLGCNSETGQRSGFLSPVGCHTWRATGITIYLENDGRLEHARQVAGHESPRTTKLCDRTKAEVTLSEVERIRL